MSLRLKAASGVRWISSSTAINVALGFLQTVLLSRILDPKDFGIMAMAWVVGGFIQVFSEMGMSNAIVQKQDATPRQLSSVYWLSLATGTLVAVLVAASGPLVSAFYREASLTGVMPLIGATLLMVSVGQPFQMVAQRELMFQRLALAEFLMTLTSLIVAVTTALAGFRFYSIVLGGLAGAVVKSSYLLLSGWSFWRPHLHFARSDLTAFLRFGSYQLGERITNYAWNNADYLLVGRYLGAEPLGIYRLAYEIVVRPLGTINPILNTVSYPIFSRRQDDDEALRRGYLELIRLLCTITFPLLSGLAIVAPVAIPLIFSEKWAGAVPLVQILCLLGALRSLTNPSASLLLAKGKANVQIWANFWQALASLVAFFIAVRYGIVPLAWTAVGIIVGVVLVSWKTYYHDTIRLPLTDWLRTVTVPAAYSVMMAALVYLLSLGIAKLEIPEILRLITLVMTGAVGYGFLLWILERSYLKDLWSLAMHRGTPS
jgi:O-antigen/teichoic acid export membrane protein